MLILTRKTNERIVIGDEIEVSVVEIRGDQVKLGIIAPKNVKVHRREVFDAIQAENRAAAEGAPTDLSGLSGLFGGEPDQDRLVSDNAPLPENDPASDNELDTDDDPVSDNVLDTDDR